jgi:hypothetical protein
VARERRTSPVKGVFTVPAPRPTEERFMPPPPQSQTPANMKQDLLSWLFTSGRFHRYLKGERQTVPHAPAPGEKRISSAALQSFFAELDIFDQGDGEEWLERMGLKPSPVERSRTPEAARADLRLVATALTGRGTSSDELWTELVGRGEMERELGLMLAIRAAAREARDRGLHASRLHRHEAEQTIALDHLFADWQELQAHAEQDGSLWWRLCAYRDDLALACAARGGFPDGLS